MNTNADEIRETIVAMERKALDRWGSGDPGEMVDPRVQIVGDAAILKFQFRSEGSEGQTCWNSTEVYRRSGEQWRIIHSHWSFQNAASAQPGFNATD